MKVSEEMLTRAMKALQRGGLYLGPDPVRAALEAALAEVPEPSCMVTGGFDEQAGRYHAEVRAEAAEAKIAQTEALVAAQEQRAKWAEAKLAKVRAIVEMYGVITSGDLQNILGEP